MTTSRLRAPTTYKNSTKPKNRTCKECKVRFTTFSSLIKWCSIECGAAIGLKLVEAKKDKAARIAAKIARMEMAARKEAAMPVKKHLKLTEGVINTYVRVRDALDGCISCDKPSHWDGVWHASHFKSVGSNSVLRYNLLNINKSCSECNWKKGGNITEYEKRLVVKIGADRVDWLKRQNGVCKYTAEYLIRMRRVFSKKTKRLLNRRGV